MAIGKTRLFGMQRYTIMYHIILECVEFLEFKISIMLLSDLVTFTCGSWYEMNILELSAGCEVYS